MPRFKHFRPPVVAAAALLLCHCGTVPGPGPSPEAIAKRVEGHEVTTFVTQDGRDLAYIAHLPKHENPRRVAFIYLHGIKSHSEWFDEAARQLAEKGYPVFSIDRRGSGINRENRGYVSGHLEEGVHLVDDIHRAVGIARSHDQVEEVFLIGLSWGGKYIMAYDAMYPDEVDGMVLITPGMKPKVDLNLVEKLAVVTDSVVSPKRQHRIPIEAEMFTTKPEYLNYIKGDQLKLQTVSASFLMESNRMDRIIDRMDDGKHPPMLVFLAGHDRIIDNEATRELVTRDPNRSVKIIEYEDQTHSIQLDAPDRLSRDIVRWVESLPGR